jgi:hypothetical protein
MDRIAGMQVRWLALIASLPPIANRLSTASAAGELIIDGLH